MARDQATRRTNVVAVVVALAVFGALLTAAVRAEGFRETRVDLNEAGVWVTYAGRAGRINTQIKSIEVAVSGEAGVDVAQAGTSVVLYDRNGGSFEGIDAAIAAPTERRQMPRGSFVGLGGPVGIVADLRGGDVWVADSAAVGQLDLDAVEPTFSTRDREADDGRGDDADGDAAVDAVEDDPDDGGVDDEATAGVVASVGPDGSVHVYRVDSTEVVSLGADGPLSSEPISTPVEGAQLTSVGGRSVLLGRDGTLVVPSGAEVDLSDLGAGLRLQQPGPTSTEVLVASDDRLVAVGLDDGERRPLVVGGGGDPVDPVLVVSAEGGACAYAAWSADSTWGRSCEGSGAGEPAERFADEQVRGGNELRYRVNRDRVVLNDTRSGVSLLVDDEEPEVVKDWDQALDQDQTDDQEQEEVVQQQQAACQDVPGAPVAPDTAAGTRPGRPVVVPVLDRAESDPCDVLWVAPFEEDRLPPREVATVAVVQDGAAVQVTPGPDQTTPVTVPYTVMGKGGETRASLVVDVTRPGDNGDPEVPDDTTVVDSGRTVRHDVLARATDPDGDALTLVDVGPDPNGGSREFQANGIVTYTAPGGFVGVVTLDVTVTDGMGGEAESTLSIRVQADGSNLPPKARNDRLVAFVGKETEIDLLANDTDPNGDELTLNSIDEVGARGLEPAFEPEGTLRVTPTEPGQYFFSYQIDDGQESAEGWVLVDVRPATTNTPPVAVRDDLVVRPGTPALVDLVANDLDADGDVLAVTSLTADPSAGLSVELLEKRVARVTASAAFVEPVALDYEVSDGLATSSGHLVVRPLIRSTENQPPVAVDDVAQVRAGNTTSIPVLRNDIDPEGEQLEIVDVSLADETLGTAFVQGDELRFQASAVAELPVTITYTVADPAGNQASADVRVDIIPPEQDNRPPRAPSVQGRVFAGGTIDIRVPLVGLDPDGDTVAIMGLEPSDPPTLGTVAVTGDGFVYQADRGAAGSDQFRFRVQDPDGASTVGTARVVVAPRPDRNSPPTAVPDRVRMAPGQTRTIPVLDNDTDPDGDPLSLIDDEIEGPSEPSGGNGTVRVEGNELVYQAPDSTPDGEPLDVSFTYGVTDGPSAARGVVTVVVDPGEPANEPPVARDDFEPLRLAGTTVVVDVLSNDRDPDGDDADLVVDVVDDDRAAVLADGTIEVRLGDAPASFVYRVTDGDGGEAMALVSIPVADVLPPQLEAAEIEMDAGSTREIDLLEYVVDPGGDPDGLEVVRVVERTVRGGTTELQGSTVAFTAEADWLRDAGFAYVVTNGDQVAVGAVRILLTGQDVPPTFRTLDVGLPEGASRTFDLQDYVEDPDTASHRFTGLQGAVPGTIDVTLTGSVMRVEAGLTAKGRSATLTFAVEDDTSSVPAEIEVVVDPNDRPPPIAVDDAAETEEGVAVSLAVTANDVDPVGEGLVITSVEVVGGAAVGSARAEGGSVTFDPASAWFGTALLTYQVTDGSDRTALGNVRVDVYGRPGIPPAPTGTAESRLVRLQWGIPSRAGTPVTGYVVEEVGSGRRTTVTTNSAVLDGLTNAVEYRYRVAALNRVVTSAADVRPDEWSEPSPVLVPDQMPDRPSAPVVTFDRDDNGGGDGGVLHVAWVPPSVDGSAISEYTVRISPVPPGGQPTRRIPAGTTRERWAGLRNGTAYTFTVVATNDAGPSLASPPSNSEVPAGVPATVGGVTAQRVTDDRNDNGGLAVVRWSPAAANGDPSGLRYRVTPSPATASGPRDVEGTTVEWSGLDPAREYTFSVVAFNRAGDARAAGTSTGVFAEGKPAPPTAPRFEPGNGEVRLFDTRTADSRGPGAITYEYSITNATSGFTTLSDDRFSRANGQTAGVWIRACKRGVDSSGSAVGCGSASRAVNRHTGADTVTPFGPPAITGTADGGRITWRWNAQPGTSTSPGGTSQTVDYGPGAPRSQSFTVTATGQGVSRSATASATTQDTRRVAISKGGPAVGATSAPYGVCTDPSCRYVRVSLEGFGPGPWRVDCWGSYQGWSSFAVYETNATVTETCWFGFPNHGVRVYVDGVLSNTIDPWGN